MQDWWWVPGDLNIANIITRGGTAENLSEDSTWQTGPEFLKLPVEEWPIKSGGEVAAHARENVDKLQRKTFSVALTRAKGKMGQKDHLQKNQCEIQDTTSNPPPPPERKPAGWVKNLLDVEKFSSLSRLIKVIAWVCRAAKK